MEFDELGRVIGYVVGSDISASGNVIWKVRVKNVDSTFHGKKLIVSSVHDNVALAKGLNVDFLLGTVDGSEGQQEMRAVDVRIAKPKEYQRNDGENGSN